MQQGSTPGRVQGAVPTEQQSVAEDCFRSQTSCEPESGPRRRNAFETAYRRSPGGLTVGVGRGDVLCTLVRVMNDRTSPVGLEGMQELSWQTTNTVVPKTIFGIHPGS